MSLDMTSFGRLIASARKSKELSQKELAALVIKEDGEAITPQYLNDIEHDRRSPSSDHIVNQFAKVLGLKPGPLFAAVGVLREEDRKLVKNSTPDKVNEALLAFRKVLRE